MCNLVRSDKYTHVVMHASGIQTHSHVQVLTVVTVVMTEYVRAVVVRLFNNCCCWDLEKQFPGYADFKIAENILHLVNNQGMVW